MIRTLQCIVLLLTLFCTNLYAGDTSNLEGAWLLDEESGTRVDQTDNGNDLTDNNTVLFGTGQFGNAADIEKDNSESLTITDAAQTGLEPTGDMSVFAWIKMETEPPNNDEGTIMTKNANFAVRVVLTGGVTKFEVGPNAPALICDTTLTTGTFFHGGFTYDATLDDLICFKECVDDGSNLNHTTGGSDTGAAVAFGAFSNGTQLFFDGLIDEPVVFSRKISTSECSDLKDNGIEAFITPVTVRNRLIIIAMATFHGLFISDVHYYSLVNKHRKKFNIERPSWMKLFDIPEAFAQTVEEKTQALTEFVERAKDQVIVNGRYKQKWPVLKNSVTYETHEYLGPRGVGYIQRAVKEDMLTGKKYFLEKHVGPETDRNISTDWTEIKEN